MVMHLFLSHQHRTTMTAACPHALVPPVQPTTPSPSPAHHGTPPHHKFALLLSPYPASPFEPRPSRQPLHAPSAHAALGTAARSAVALPSPPPARLPPAPLAASRPGPPHPFMPPAASPQVRPCPAPSTFSLPRQHTPGPSPQHAEGVRLPAPQAPLQAMASCPHPPRRPQLHRQSTPAPSPRATPPASTPHAPPRPLTLRRSQLGQRSTASLSHTVLAPRPLTPTAAPPPGGTPTLSSSLSPP